MGLSSYRRIAAILVLHAFWTASVFGQPPDDGSPMMQLNLPADGVTLNVLADLVSERLQIQIIYDDELKNESISIKAPKEMPESSLLPLLESILKIKGFAVVDAEVEGWKRIVKSEKLTTIARPPSDTPLNEIPATEAVTQAFVLKFTSPKRIEELIKPFLTEPGADTILLDEQNTLIVTDYAGNLARIEKLVAKIDVTGPAPELEFVTIEHVEAGALQKQLTQVMASQAPAVGAGEMAVQLQITPDIRTNQLLLSGTKTQVEKTKQLIEALDVPLGVESRVYSFQFVEAVRIDKLMKDLLDPLTVERLYRSSVDENDNLLIVSAPPDIHQRIAELQERIDVESQRAGSAVKFYRLKYADAAEVLQTIFAVQSGERNIDLDRSRGVSPLGRGRFNDNQYNNAQPSNGTPFVPGPNTPASPGSTELPTPPAVILPPDQAQDTPPGVSGAPQETDLAAILGATIQVTADPRTNSIIVVADRTTQQVYADLIEYLDRRRPQVMIEAKVVILDTTNSYALGIELSGGDRTGLNRTFNFSSFGLSTVDPTNGALSLAPGLGYNFALVRPDVADAVVRALATHTKARVMSAPRVLVNDNATGVLASVNEVPFTSVNASDTVATTSFAGFAEAGTTIQVTPRISDDDELQLDFIVTLNSFTGTGSDGVPPPRQTNEVSSSVTIPDGYTVIVGGLNQKNESFDQDSIPFIEKIPALRALTSNTVKSNNQNTLFVFLRPIILRDDKFEDLKYLSDRDVRPSGLRKNFPSSQPLLVK
ncbi:MAG: secretin N-terminal domain-containing protein [Planctomycetota bacterium]